MYQNLHRSGLGACVNSIMILLDNALKSFHSRVRANNAVFSFTHFDRFEEAGAFLKSRGGGLDYPFSPCLSCLVKNES